MEKCGANPLNKLILTNGDYLEVSNRYQRKIYFDQGGYLTNKLNISTLPAVVRQKGEFLYVEEFPLE
jgi:conjugal transfer pilus assembly protein TraW